MGLDGTTGEVVAGKLPTRPSEVIQVARREAEAGRLAALPAVRADPRVGRRGSAARRARQCRHAARRPRRPRVRRGGHRPLPHGAHVLRGGADHRGSRDDPGRDSGGAKEGARQDPAHAARRFRRHLPRDGRAAGHDPAPRPAAPRVPPPRAEGARRDRQGDGNLDRRAEGEGRRTVRGQSDARPPRLPAWADAPGNLRDPGPRDLRGGRGGRPKRVHRRRDHDPSVGALPELTRPAR